MNMIRTLTAILFLLLASSASAQVIAENFRNTDCANCKVPDDQYEKFIHDNPNLKVILVNYHNSFPSPNDPFYLASKNDVNPRSNNFYQVISDPYMFVDGYSAGSKVSDWKTLTQEAAAITKPFTVNVAQSFSGDLLTIDAHVTGSSSAQVRPYALILESGIIYNNDLGYGNPPSGKWNDIVRAILPTANGGDPETISGSKHFQFTYDLTGKDWNKSNLHIVFFLQKPTKENGNNYPILGVGKTELSSVGKNMKHSSGFSLRQGGINPFTKNRYISLSADKPAQVKVILSNVLGNDVGMLFEGYVSGDQVIDIDNVKLSEGVYFARLFVGNEQVDVLKFENHFPMIGR
jgi:hypothetical protein